MRDRSRQLADHYLKAARIAAVNVDADGAVVADIAVGIERAPGRVSFCCLPGDEVRLARLARAYRGDQAATLAHLEDLAELNGIGLTPHHTVVQRAFAAVHHVEETIHRMHRSGGMKALNAAFKAALKADPSLRYYDYLQAQKLSMLETMATASR